MITQEYLDILRSYIGDFPVEYEWLFLIFAIVLICSLLFNLYEVLHG